MLEIRGGPEGLDGDIQWIKRATEHRANWFGSMEEREGKERRRKEGRKEGVEIELVGNNISYPWLAGRRRTRRTRRMTGARVV